MRNLPYFTKHGLQASKLLGGLENQTSVPPYISSRSI